MRMPRQFYKKGNSKVKDRIMSASRRHAKELQNEIFVLYDRLQALRSENKLLRRVQQRQDTALQQYEGKCGELPSLLQAHHDEVRCLRKRLKESQCVNRVLEERLKDRDRIIGNLREEKKHLDILCQKLELPEKEELQAKITMLKQKLQKSEQNVQRHIYKLNLLEKSRKQHLAMETSRHRDTCRQLEQTQDMLSKLNVQLMDERRNQSLTYIRCHKASAPGPEQNNVNRADSTSDVAVQTGIELMFMDSYLPVENDLEYDSSPSKTPEEENPFDAIVSLELDMSEENFGSLSEDSYEDLSSDSSALTVISTGSCALEEPELCPVIEETEDAAISQDVPESETHSENVKPETFPTEEVIPEMDCNVPLLWKTPPQPPEVPKAPRHEYHFTQTIENLHQGKPTHEGISVPVLEHVKREKAKSGEKSPVKKGHSVPWLNSDSKKVVVPSPSSVTNMEKDLAAVKRKTALMEELFGHHTLEVSVNSDTCKGKGDSVSNTNLPEDTQWNFPKWS